MTAPDRADLDDGFRVPYPIAPEESLPGYRCAARRVPIALRDVRRGDLVETGTLWAELLYVVALLVMTASVFVMSDWI